ncbi:MAG: cupin domain-containing protein [Desulfomonile sp.]|nr:cupin domain-containing protein [Desulfomonile sp.]
MQVYTWNSIESEKISDSIARKMFWGNNIMVTRWELKPFTVLPEHSHEAEQVTMVLSGSVTLAFSGGEEISLHPGDMLVIPPNVPHGVKIGPEGSTAIDLFSPIREDFIQQSSAYLGQGLDKGKLATEPPPSKDEVYRTLQSYLLKAGVRASLEELQEYPIIDVARLAFERECISMGQLRLLLGLDKQQAKDLLREWKHGDDHSAASLRKMMTQKVILPGERGHDRKEKPCPPAPMRAGNEPG